jgi:glycogen debranching enzyme
MCNVWSWDHCFNALALAYKAPQMAWDQFMIMFDFQTAIGCLPDSVNDSKIIHNYCKPPIHGWMLRKLMQVMPVSDEQLLDAYDKLTKWTNWWLTCRDNNNDGLCEYNHGNDSGWDNSTAFSEMPPTTTPDLAAFLILQMDVLSKLAEKFGKKDEVVSWKEKSATMLATMIEKLYENGEPHALDGLDNRVHKCDTLLFYLPLILGDRLPEDIRKKGIATLKSDKFVTTNGFATESPASSMYEDDGYWRGPIWAPSTWLLVQGLEACGRTTEAKETAKNFCDLCKEYGFAENFDAINGTGKRDRSYTWTSSIFLVLANEFLLDK